MTSLSSLFFFFNDTATTEIYTLSLHDALPILDMRRSMAPSGAMPPRAPTAVQLSAAAAQAKSSCFCKGRSEEHTSELQSRLHLVCRLLLEKKKKFPCRRSSSPRLSPARTKSPE